MPLKIKSYILSTTPHNTLELPLGTQLLPGVEPTGSPGGFHLHTLEWEGNATGTFEVVCLNEGESYVPLQARP